MTGCNTVPVPRSVAQELAREKEKVKREHAKKRRERERKQIETSAWLDFKSFGSMCFID